MKKNAFSLVELSIVLVILGLLVGGVLSGQSLIRASELRSVTTDFMRYKAAVNSFRDKYFALPGDMANATSFWGSLGGAGNDDTCQAILATGLPTCNGDGDGTMIDSISIGTLTPEMYRFWQHLANAGLIEGHYTGTFNTGNVAGTNVAASRLSNAYFIIASTNPTYNAGSVTQFAGERGNPIQLTSAGFSNNTAGSGPLAPEDAWNIDTKLDDGAPGTGSVIGFKGKTVTTPCSTTASGPVANDAGSGYNLVDSNKDCYLYFVRAF